MKYNFKLFFSSFYKSFFKSKGTHARLTKKRLGFLILFYIVWPIWGITIWISFFLDNLFLPNYKRQKIKKPLFIIGNFRSGSTYLQRLIAKDKNQFASTRTWDIFLSPSIILTRLFSALLSFDNNIGNPLKKSLRRLDERTLSQVDIHKISFFEAEEDENILLHNWSSFFAGVMFPFMEDYLPYSYFDSRVPKGEKSSIMSFYRSMVQRFLYSKQNKELHFLSKNPAFCPKIRSLIEHFPDAKIVYLVRNPMEMLPSTISWLSYTWHVFNDPLVRYPYIPEIMDFTKHWYEYPLNVLSKSDPSNYLIVDYDDLVQKPKETVRKIYNHFGYKMSEEFYAELNAMINKANNFRSKHRYSLKDMGISKQQILNKYDTIFQRFNFDTKLNGESIPQNESTLN